MATGEIGARTLGELEKIRDPLARAQAAGHYMSSRTAAVSDARKIRDRAIGSLLASGGSPTDLARKLGLSVSLVKTLRPRS